MLLMQMLRHKETLALNLHEVLSLGIGLGKHLQSPLTYVFVSKPPVSNLASSSEA